MVSQFSDFTLDKRPVDFCRSLVQSEMQAVSYFIYRMIGIILGWVLFIFIAYKTSQVELDFKDFDPYAELEIDRVSSMY